jgi:N utilization substance protein B
MVTSSSPAQSQSRQRGGAANQARRQGRVHALSLAYAYDQKHYLDDESLAISSEAASLADGAVELGEKVFHGLREERAAVDAIVDKCLTNWTLGRMAVLDRSILRLGCYELIYCPDVPPKVVINEYIEIAKQYGSDVKTGKLVNGVLDRIAKEHSTKSLS